MSYDEPTAILEGRRTTTGNGNYDVATIAAAASRLVDSQPSEAEQQIHDVIEDAQRMFDELLANPSSGLVEEATQFLNAFARYMPPGLAAQARHAISLQEERIAASPDRSGPTGDNWREQRERDDKERKDQAKIADMADDAQNALQLSTKPDQYGLSEQNYSDLNDQLKTRDGQERMMAFLRMMYPNKTDAERVELLQNMTLIARAESPEGTAEDRRAVEALDPAKAAEARGAMSSAVRFQQGQSVTPEAAPPAALVTATDARVADTTTISVAGSQAWLEQDFATAPSLRTNFVAANAATAPLDSPAEPVRPTVAIASAQPVQPLAPAGSGFDV